MNPNVGFSTVKKCFDSNAVVDDDDAIAFDILLLLSTNTKNDDVNRILVNSRYPVIIDVYGTFSDGLPLLLILALQSFLQSS